MPCGSTLQPTHILDDLTTFCFGFYHPEHTVSILWSKEAFVASTGMTEFGLYNTETVLKHMTKYSNRSSWEM